MRWNVAVAALASSWGLIAVIVSEVDLGAQVLVFYRLAFAALVLGLVALVLRRLRTLRLVRHRPRIVVIGVTLAAHWFNFATIKLSSVAVAVLLAYVAPIAPLLLVGARVLPTAAELPAVLALGVVFTALSGYLYIWFLRHVTAQAIGVLAYIEPVSAALLARALLDEALSWQVIAGVALVIVAGATVVFLEPADAAAPETAPLAPG